MTQKDDQARLFIYKTEEHKQNSGKIRFEN